jgi:hypothetical protein
VKFTILIRPNAYFSLDNARQIPVIVTFFIYATRVLAKDNFQDKAVKIHIHELQERYN